MGDLGLPVALVMAAMECADELVQSSSPLLTSIVKGAYTGGTLPSPDQLSQLYVFAKHMTSKAPSASLSPELLTAIPPQPFNDRVKALLLDIQSGDGAMPTTRQLWQRLVSASQLGYNSLYQRLDVTVTEQGESTYVADLPGVVAALKASGSAVQSDGAWVVPVGSDPTTNQPLPPMLIEKSNGGSVCELCAVWEFVSSLAALCRYLYATIDVAAIRRRINAGFNHIVYVTDSSQCLHFTSLFQVNTSGNRWFSRY